VAILLISCAAVVALWQIMASLSRRPFRPFQVTQDTFTDFAPSGSAWSVTPLPVHNTPIEPNILAYLVRRSSASTPDNSTTALATEAAGSATAVFAVAVRLVHGYNLPDCMRIKGYQVELIADTRETESGLPPAMGLREPGQPAGSQGTDSPLPRQLQVWRLTAGGGSRSIWVSSMLRAGDFGETAVDARSMAFPRIGTPDDPGWLPRGITLQSLRHPLRNFRLFLRTKWNNSRCDLATFLRLRQPSWASDEMLTLVATSEQAHPAGEVEDTIVREVVAAHGFMQSALQTWRRTTMGVDQR
jgi:hypothetical protein